MMHLGKIYQKYVLDVFRNKILRRNMCGLLVGFLVNCSLFCLSPGLLEESRIHVFEGKHQVHIGIMFFWLYCWSAALKGWMCGSVYVYWKISISEREFNFFICSDASQQWSCSPTDKWYCCCCLWDSNVCLFMDNEECAHLPACKALLLNISNMMAWLAVLLHHVSQVQWLQEKDNETWAL